MSTTSEKTKNLFLLGRFSNTLAPFEKKIIDLPRVKPKKIILLAGPTACGKTALSLMLAKALKGEIISADSMQVYKGMDIGTAKIAEEEQLGIPHYLINIRSIQESFNIVDFYKEATQCCESILARDKVPIIVGGTGFYFRALLYGPPQGPPSVADLRHQLEEDIRKFGPEALYEKLKTIDPAYAATITAGDKHKIVRALEIITLTGESVSKLSWQREKVTSDFRFCAWFLHRPRTILYERIEKRCETMLDAGLIEEVVALEKEGLRNNSSASQAIGYRQVLEYLKTERTAIDYEHLDREFKMASRHYAKRQFTWFRKEPIFRWLDIEMHDFEIAADMIIQDYIKIF